jgi:hypothetical protein
MDFGFTTFPAIAVICYLITLAVKSTPLDNKWLPVIAGACGGILGIVAMLTVPEYPAKDGLTAIAMGVVSGLAATGANQIYKQLTAPKDGNPNGGV